MPAISQITAAFKKLLEEGLKDAHLDPVINIGDPTEMIQLGTAGTSLWLYQVAHDEFSRNAAPAVVQQPTGDQPRKRNLVPPMGVNLSFLLTPMTGNVTSDYDVMEQILLTIHEAPLLSVRDTTLAFNDVLRVDPLTDTLDERLRLWEALPNQPYRLSFTCLVRTARLISRKIVQEPHVRRFDSVEFPVRERTRR